MSESTAETNNAPAQAKNTPDDAFFEKDDLDAGLDVNNLPPLPWTQKNLGTFEFKRLASVMGVGDLLGENPSLDVRTFGLARANRIINALKLDQVIKPTPDGNGEISKEEYDRVDTANAEREEQAQAYRDEGAALQRQIDAALPKVAGSVRSPKIPKLTPTTSVFKETSNLSPQGAASISKQFVHK